MATDGADKASARSERRENGSPPPPQPSKRDKRRQTLVDRIAALDDKFGHGDRDQLFREQLQRIQLDANLVMSIDPYADRPLDAFDKDEQRYMQLMNDGGENPPRPVLDAPGPRLQDWIQEVQDLVEARDVALTKCKFEYENKCREYQNTYAFQVETAKREHDALSKSLRDRLLNTLTAKKNRLNKEKEALEISDASALLLHPSQFSINNPSSPGGIHGKRSTRQRRDVEDPGAEGRKRKRNGGDDDGSPVPQRRALDAADSTPIWQNDRLVGRKVTGDIYSLEKLFTDKELCMKYNQAALSAHKHLLTHKARVDENGQVVSSSEDSDETGDNDEATPEILSAPMMERNVSHATRSARGNGNPNFTDNKVIGLEALGSHDLPGNFERMVAADPRLPTTFPSAISRGHTKQGEMNATTAFTADLVDHDLGLMALYKQYDAQHGPGACFSHEYGGRKILEAATQPTRFVAYLQGMQPSENEVRKQLGLPVVVQPEEAGTPSKNGRSGTPAHMTPAKQGGLSGVAGLGAVTMSRQSSGSGAPMSRSSSRQKTRTTRGG